MDISMYLLPGLAGLCIIIGVWKGVPVYDAFIIGAKEGLKTAVQILPCMIAMLTAIGLMTGSGILGALEKLLGPVFSAIGILPEAAPLMLLRPLSGSASLAMLQDVFVKHGPDSIAGLLASTLMGSSETIFYTVGLYLSTAGVKKSRYAVPAALGAWLAGSIAAGWFYH